MNHVADMVSERTRRQVDVTTLRDFPLSRIRRLVLLLRRSGPNRGGQGWPRVGRAAFALAVGRSGPEEPFSRPS